MIAHTIPRPAPAGRRASAPMIGDLLPDGVISAEAFADDPDATPFPGEEDLIANAVPARRREFTTARRCARDALTRLGHRPAPLRSGPHREPLWPAGVIGSITHCTGYRAAAVARRGATASLGIDAEPHHALPTGILASVAGHAEQRHLTELRHNQPGIHWDRLLFSAKESAFKAWYPLTGRWLGFQDAHLEIDQRRHTWTAHLLVDGTRQDTGPALTAISGRYAVRDGLVTTTAVVNDAAC